MNTYVLPRVAPGLEPVARVAGNWAWTFDHEFRAFTEKLRVKLSGAEETSPATWLHALSLEQQAKLAEDKELVAEAQRLVQKLDQKPSTDRLVAYFSAEYGVHEALANYAGGLGILAGDHLKSAHDVGVPLIGVGLWYGRGYHEQRIAEDGAPREAYIHADPYALGAKLATLPDGKRLTVWVDLGARNVHLQVWQLEVGRTRLMLLDADVPENTPEDRRITQALYGGDHHVRILQELVLGIGGVFALEALGHKPTVYHLNEGHAAFLSLARLHIAQRDLNLSLEECAELVTASNVFTTHTPIAAGNDVFHHSLLLPYLMPVCASLQLPLQWVVQKGMERPGSIEERFSMTAFALNFCARRNGVSEEHGHVSRRLWQQMWPGHTEGEVGIGSVTNGVHLPTWTAPSMQKHFDAGTDFRKDKRVLRARLCDYVNQHTPATFSADTLTLGFARRFAEYKRALLLFSDPARLHRLLENEKRPVQLVFAGKAHPNADREKANIKRLHDLMKEHKLNARIAFIENYNMRVARLLVQGVDVWLNTPRPPLEASGTSGMKVLLNGALNASVCDGWWKEAYAPGLGWAIGEQYDPAVDDASRDMLDARSLYHSLETEIAPIFYDNHDEWVRRCHASAKALAPRFHARRMVEEYAKNFYQPAHEEQVNAQEAQRRARERLAITERFSHVGVEWRDVPRDGAQGERMKVSAHVNTGGLSAEQLRIELVTGTPSEQGFFDTQNVRVVAMDTTPSEGGLRATAEVTRDRAGPLGVWVRVLPRWSSRLLATQCIMI